MTKYTVFKSWSTFFGNLKFEVFADKRTDSYGGYLFQGESKEEWMNRHDIAELYRFFRAAHEELRRKK